ncbi:MAG: GNAT family N-acetyltransferase, partial [Paraclostridium sp.]
KGIGSEAISKVIEFGFEELRLNKIEARCMYKNEASEKVMIKNGMRLDGILRNDKWYQDRFIDLKLYSILKTDKVN